MKESGKLEERLGDPVLAWQYTASRVVGVIALTIGLSLLVFIFASQIYAIAVISVVGTAAMTLFEIFVSIIPAYIFTILSAIFIGAGLSHEH